MIQFLILQLPLPGKTSYLMPFTHVFPKIQTKSNCIPHLAPNPIQSFSTHLALTKYWEKLRLYLPCEDQREARNEKSNFRNDLLHTDTQEEMEAP